MSRFARNVDANQAQLVAVFRAAGCSVLHLHTVGAGCPDLLVGWGGVDVQVEVKDGAKPPSAQKLTPAEEAHHRTWRGRPVEVVRDVDEALALVARLRGEALRG